MPLVFRNTNTSRAPPATDVRDANEHRIPLVWTDRADPVILIAIRRHPGPRKFKQRIRRRIVGLSDFGIERHVGLAGN